MFGLKTYHPVALESRDHIVPGGTMMDSTNNPLFLQKVYSLFVLKPELRSFALLDLGCSSGRLVEQVIQDGHFAAGLEGCDYSLARQRASWSRIPENLFTCDITEPFTLYSKIAAAHMELALPFRFDVITCWEVMEHIKEGKPLDTLCQNVLNHLMPDGYWMMSISFQPGYHHMTVKDKQFWMEYFERKGFKNNEAVCEKLGRDWPRGPDDPSSFNLALVRKVIYPS